MSKSVGDLGLDSHKLMHHPDRIASWMKGENIYPIYVEIGLSSACNQACIFCGLDFIEHKGKFLDREVLKGALTGMGEKGVKSVMFSGAGEPTLHKDIPLFVEHAKTCGMDVAITTNGVLFTGEKARACLPCLSWIRFSVDAGSPDSYSKIHGANPATFEKLMHNIRTTVEIRDKKGYSAKIGAQAVLLEENCNEMILLAKKIKDLGADYLAIKPYSQHPDSRNRFNLNYENFKTLQQPLEVLNSDKFKVFFRSEAMAHLGKQKTYPECYGLPFFALIDAEGNVLPCNLFYDKKKYYYGNLYEKTFSQIWGGDCRKNVQAELHREGTGNCRESCRLDLINMYLYSLKNPPEHVNFI